MKYSVYILKCPDSLCVKYIGMTINISQRYKAHLSGNGVSNQKLIGWLYSLRNKTKKPIMSIAFGNLTHYQALKKEKELIYEYSKQNILLNVMHTLQTKENNILKRIKNKESHTVINIPITPELKKKLKMQADKANIKLSTYCRIKLIEAK